MINVSKLNRELVAAGLPVVGVSADEDGNFLRIDWPGGIATPEQFALAQQVVAAHDPTDTIALRQEQARAAYKLLVALRDMTPDEAAAWVDANVVDFASAKSVMRIFARLLCILVRAGDLDDR